MSLTIGHPNAGWHVRAKRIKKSKVLAIKVGSDSNTYGHPALVLMLRAQRQGDREGRARNLGCWSGIFPASRADRSVGHRSHQSGRDADIGFYALGPDGKPVTPDKFVSFTTDGRATDGSGLTFDDRRNWLLVQSWVRDKRAGLSHIFVSRGLTAAPARLCGQAAGVPEVRD